MPSGCDNGVPNKSFTRPTHSRNTQIEFWDSHISHRVRIDSRELPLNNHAAGSLRETGWAKVLVKMCGVLVAGNLRIGKAHRRSRARSGVVRRPGERISIAFDCQPT